MYDDANFDDVVGYITSASGLVEVIATPDLRPGDVVVIPLLLSPGRVVSLDPPAARHPPGGFSDAQDGWPYPAARSVEPVR